MKKKLLAGLLTIALVASTLTGCGNGNKPSSDDSNASQQEESTKNTENEENVENAEDTAPASDDTESTTLKWAVWDIASTVYYQPLIDAFEEANPGVKIEMVDLGSTDYQTVLATELTGSGSGLDIATIKDVPGYTTLVNKGVLEPFGDWIAQDGIDLSQYGGITDQVTVDGQLYELPFRNDFWVLFYNKDIFDNAEVAYPTNDMTFDQYDALARSVTNTTPGQEVYGSHYHTWRGIIQEFGILDGQHTVVDGTYDFTRPYYEMVVSQQDDGVCQDYATLKTSGLHYSGAFAQGNIAMMPMGAWFIPTLIAKIKSGEYGPEIANWGLAKYPHPEGVEAGTSLATITALAIPTSAPNKDLAWEFVKFVCGPEGAAVVASTGSIPAIMTDSAVEAISGLEGFPEDEESVEALRTVRTYLEMPVHAKTSEIETALNEIHDNIMTESISVDEGIAMMNEAVQAILAE